MSARPTPAGGDPACSVVVCTRDRPRSLRRCLRALARLEPAAAEVLVIDNASATGETRAVVAETAFRYLRERRPGLDWARNRGLAEARCAVVAFVDDDVVVDRRWLAGLVSAFADPEVAGVTGLVLPAELETPAQRFFEAYGGGMSRGLEPRLFVPSAMTPAERLAVQAIGVGASMAFRRSLLERLGGFDTALDVGTPTGGGGDLDLFHRALAAGAVIRDQPAALAWHHHRREIDDLRRQLHAYGRAYGAYLIQRWRRREVARGQVLLAAAGHGTWLLGRVALGLIGRHRLPLGLLLSELRGALESPWAHRRSYRRDRRLRHGDGRDTL